MQKGAKHSPSRRGKDKNPKKDSVSMKEKMDKTAEAKRKFAESFPELSGRLVPNKWCVWTDGPLPANVTKDEVCEHCDPDGFSDLLRPGVLDRRRRWDPERDVYRYCKEHHIWECNECAHWSRLSLLTAKNMTKSIDADKARAIMDECLGRIETEARVES